MCLPSAKKNKRTYLEETHEPSGVFFGATPRFVVVEAFPAPSIRAPEADPSGRRASSWLPVCIYFGGLTDHGDRMRSNELHRFRAFASFLKLLIIVLNVAGCDRSIVQNQLMTEHSTSIEGSNSATLCVITVCPGFDVMPLVICLLWKQTLSEIILSTVHLFYSGFDTLCSR